MLSGQNCSDLLNEFELILDSDPLIDEVGFIHPSQFATLEGNGESVPKEERAATTNFWNREHKLGISTDVVIQLYRVAKDACLSAIREYKSSQIENNGDSTAKSEVLKHSKAVLLLSCDFGTAWNSRKLILSRKQHMPLFIDELCLSALVLSYSPKSDQAWCHRRWVIKMIAGKCSALQDVLATESDLVEKIAERSKMNYRAWNHRCWLVSYMAREQVLNELVRSRNWACLHVADSSCFHYRMRLLLRILEKSSRKQEKICFNYCMEIYRIWQEELEWNEVLLRRYVGREALWLHRRFLSLCWIRHFATSPGDTSNHSENKASTNADVVLFLDNELHLVSSCSTVPDNDFEDFESQEVYSAVYILWLMKVGNGGIVRDPQVLQEVLDRIIKGVETYGFCSKGWIESPLKGAEGNTEFLVHFTRILEKNSE